MTEVPQFARPFRLIGSRFAVVAQDTPQEVADCIETALVTEPGSRVERPDYGTPPMLFQQAPIDVARIENAANRLEPRAGAVITEDPDRWDDLVRHVTVRLGGTA